MTLQINREINMANAKVYLGNLSKSASEDKLNAHFSQYGEIAEVLLPLDRKSNEIKGYGFIIFAKEASAQKALEQDGQTIFGQAISVQIATEKTRGKKK